MGVANLDFRLQVYAKFLHSMAFVLLSVFDSALPSSYELRCSHSAWDSDLCSSGSFDVKYVPRSRGQDCQIYGRASAVSAWPSPLCY